MKKPNKLITPEIAAKLRAGVARAASVPGGLNMLVWIKEDESQPCHTAGCLAFEIAAANSPLKPKELLKRQHRAEQREICDGSGRGSEWLPNYAAKTLGLSFDLLDATLFHTGSWPRKYQDQFDAARTPKGEVAVLRRVVEYFIANDGDW